MIDLFILSLAGQIQTRNTGVRKVIHLSSTRRKAIFLLLGLEHAIFEPKF